MTVKSAGRERLLTNTSDSDDFCMKPNNGRLARMQSMKKLTSIRHLMSTGSGAAAALLDDIEEGHDSFNISFRDFSNPKKAFKSMDDSVLGELQKDRGFTDFTNSGGLQFTKDNGLQFNPRKVKQETVISTEEPELDLFTDKRTAVSRRNQMSRMQSRRTLAKTQKEQAEPRVRRSQTTGGSESNKSGSSTSSRRRASTSTTSISTSSSRRTSSGRRSSSNRDSTSRRSATSVSESSSSRRESKHDQEERHEVADRENDKKADEINEETQDESASSSAPSSDNEASENHEAEQEEFEEEGEIEGDEKEPRSSLSSRPSATTAPAINRRATLSSGRPRIMHRAQSVRGGMLTAYSEQAKSTRKLESSKRDNKPSIQVTRATPTAGSSRSSGKSMRRQNSTDGAKDKPSADGSTRTRDRVRRHNSTDGSTIPPSERTRRASQENSNVETATTSAVTKLQW
jgi:hypothetical protein